MKLRILSVAAIVASISLPLTADASSALVFTAHDTVAQEKPAELKVSKDETDAGAKIDQAVGPAAKLQAAAEFLKKYPKSALRPRIASFLAGALSNVDDPAQESR